MSEAAADVDAHRGPFSTSDLPGTGGAIKQREDDFLVEEQGGLEPAGEGEHLLLFLEKHGLSTAAAAGRVARAFGVEREAVSFAGRKDRVAVARQHCSVHLPGRREPPGVAARLEEDGLPVLWADRHTRKLRPGQLAANRFVVRIRGVEPTSVLRAKPILARLARRGLPNGFDRQRFGRLGRNAEVGRLLLQGHRRAALDALLGRPPADANDPEHAPRAAYDRGASGEAEQALPAGHWAERRALKALAAGKSPAQAVRALGKREVGLLIASAQSAVFNRVLAERLQAGTWTRLLEGDLAWKHDNGAVFAVGAVEAEQENASEGRAASLDVSPSGPLWGRRMSVAAGRVAEAEERALRACAMAPADWESRRAPRGARRPLRVPVRDPDCAGGVDEHGPYVRLAFELPPGAYATALVREVTKNDPQAESPDDA
jgi:tRNA pseudouridine13 synthase